MQELPEHPHFKLSVSFRYFQVGWEASGNESWSGTSIGWVLLNVREGHAQVLMQLRELGRCVGCPGLRRVLQDGSGTGQNKGVGYKRQWQLSW